MSSASFHEFLFLKEKLTLLPQKALYWKKKKLLVISDMHFGKSGHFRKHGIAVPKTVNNRNLTRLNQLLDILEVTKIIFLGDLFHSDSNSEIEDFKKWREDHSGIQMYLTIGNHDILRVEDYENMQLEVTRILEAPPFVFVHDYEDMDSNDQHKLYPVCGHMHPSVKLKGKGRQKAFFSCFYFGKKFALLPAFGSFTGTFRISPAQGEQVFAVIDEQIVDFSSNFKQG